MVNYPNLSSLTNSSGIEGLLRIPNDSYPYYWLWMISGIWLIIVSTLYFIEREKRGTGKILSSMAVACLAIVVLSTIGTILGIISLDIMIYILVFSLIIVGIWFWSGKD